MPSWVFVALAAPATLGILWWRWRNASIRERVRAGERALAAGELDDAAAIFEAMLADRGTARFGRRLLATTRMRQERLGEAIELLSVDGGELAAKVELARLHALRADVTRAAQLASEAQRASARERSIDRATVGAQLVLVDVLIRCRAGELETARALLVREWHQFETPDGGGWRAEARLVRGFLDDAAGQGIEIWLGLDQPVRARVRWMAAEWPELRAFLDAHDAT